MATITWFVYLVRCHDQTLYTGITRDLKRRVAEHNSEKGGAKYTRSRQPVQLVYAESVKSRSEASKREYQLKKMSRARKQALIGTTNPIELPGPVNTDSG
ncbi:MAG: GIY-YIG nuclease family protein [Deltaproteobacteria bacterium]|nr:MAG: GIY-YIG nuclease family protein [Deltaproteobacteria bacterium]